MSSIPITFRTRLSARALKEQYYYTDKEEHRMSENAVVFITRAYGQLMSDGSVSYAFESHTLKHNTAAAFNALNPRVYYRDVTADDIHVELTRGWHEIRRLPNPTGELTDDDSS